MIDLFEDWDFGKEASSGVGIGFIKNIDGDLYECGYVMSSLGGCRATPADDSVWDKCSVNEFDLR
jgi:hypothetical protein